MIVKYALLTFPRFAEITSVFPFNSDTYFWPEGLGQHIKGNHRIAHWKEWLGSIVWKKVESSQSFITWMPTSSPDVLDSENKLLMGTNINCAWFSMLLTSPLSIWGENECVAMSGCGTLVNDQVQLNDIREVSTYNQLIRPLYDCSINFIQSPHSRIITHDWIDDWKIKYNTMLAKSKNSQILPAFNDFLESFQDGRTTRNPTTRIARFVEASETIIALPRGGGKLEFANRAFSLTGNQLLADPWLNWTDTDLKENFQRCYDIRNTRNHGKGMTADLPNILGIPKGSNKEINEALAKVEYIAEKTAKALASYVLQYPEKYEFLRTRSDIEMAWKKKIFLDLGSP